jgi:hypothetical protein
VTRITLQDAQAWGEKSKLLPALSEFDTDLLGQVEVEILGKLGQVADTSTWLTPSATPELAKTIIAKMYVAWVIDRQYSEDDDLSAYAAMLRASAVALQTAIISSEIDMPGVVVTGDGLPSSWPDDTTPGPYFCMDAVY